jgi:hypothetical protein
MVFRELFILFYIYKYTDIIAIMEYLKHLYTGTLSSGYREDTIEQNFLDVIP